MGKQDRSNGPVYTFTMFFGRENLAAALQLLRTAVGPIRAKAGCRSCTVSQDVSDEAAVRYTEEWDSAESFRRHVNSNEFWPILMTLDLCCKPPEVRMGTCASSSAVELLRKLRRKPKGADAGAGSENCPGVDGQDGNR
jgi:quinol monooxygenase YgiN